MNAIDLPSLDLLSTSQTNQRDTTSNGPVLSDDDLYIVMQIEQARGLKSERCDNNAPYIFFIAENGRPRIVQGCCNSWLCQRCGHLRALAEYGRMVEGARQLSQEGHLLYFLTLTCRGSDVSVETANRDYMKWTNRFLTNCRTEHKRRGGFWAYVQVTERQKRGHPHSHLITTYKPQDAKTAKHGDRLHSGAIAKRDTLDSARLVSAAVSSGLGRMVDLTEIREPEAVAVYVAKYLFKDAMQTEWPKGWRRIRYSRSWPKPARFKSPVAFPLVKIDDWYRMQALGVTVYADSQATLDAAYARLITCVVLGHKGGV